jgi:RHS repeat-associated protein
MERGDLDTTTASYGELFTLDAVGNWTGYGIDADGDGDTGDAGDLAQSREHNAANEIADDTDAITETNGASWIDPDYDDAGNMTIMPQVASPDTTGGHAIQYDAWNRPRYVFVDNDSDGIYDSGVGQDGFVAEFKYDGLNRRIMNLTNTDERHYYYNAAWQVCEVQEWVGGGTTKTPIKQYVWDLRYIDTPIFMDLETDSQLNGLDHRYYYLNDANMNVTALVDGAEGQGQVVERYRYDPYGKVHFLTAGFGYRGSSNFDNRVLFAGYIYDPATGLSLARNRYYHPLLGRWIIRDLSGYIDGPNLSQYCISNPVMGVDPTGRERLAYTYHLRWIPSNMGDFEFSRADDAAERRQAIEDVQDMVFDLMTDVEDILRSYGIDAANANAGVMDIWDSHERTERHLFGSTTYDLHNLDDPDEQVYLAGQRTIRERTDDADAIVAEDAEDIITFIGGYHSTRNDGVVAGHLNTTRGRHMITVSRAIVGELGWQSTDVKAAIAHEILHHFLGRSIGTNVGDIGPEHDINGLMHPCITIADVADDRKLMLGCRTVEALVSETDLTEEDISDDVVLPSGEPAWEVQRNDPEDRRW